MNKDGVASIGQDGKGDRDADPPNAYVTQYGRETFYTGFNMGRVATQLKLFH